MELSIGLILKKQLYESYIIYWNDLEETII